MAETQDWRQSPLKRAEVAAIANLGYPVVRALTSTWTWNVSGAEHVDAITAAGHHPILALWHGRILAATPYFANRGIVAMASENFDGEWIARLLGKFGYGAARGSTSRGGPAALRQLVRDVKAHGVAFTVDGPRGPAEVAQAGAVWLARATGQPLLPFHSEAASSWTLRSWDRTQIPKPFTTVAMAIEQPIYVPREAGPDALEACRRELEASLKAAQSVCQRLLA
ncbi:MAG: lysophospholipid acyltransferase family protein [Acidobacteriota bacterium]|nr:lysophospholipid acyltransferase family protein [Acidobacteriota bacterium]MDP2391206.1 lysophospholipid acyltransferase family protein [Acidobacteriota bacterium]